MHPLTSARWASLPTGNLFSLSALSLVTNLHRFFIDGFTHLCPERGLFNQSFVAEDLFHNKVPPIVLTAAPCR